MKTKLFIAVLALTSTLSQVSLARSVGGGFRDRKPVRVDVKWMGTLRCEDRETEVAHKNEQKCKLEFVNAETNEVWEVKENPALTAFHQNADKDSTVHIEAVRSPRYPLGGSFVEIKKIEALPLEVVASHTLPDASSKQAHVCSLDTSTGVN